MSNSSLRHENLTRSIIGAFFEVYNNLGYGFLERTYVMALERELRARGHKVGTEVQIAIRYKGEPLGIHRLDLLVDDCVIVETKSTEKLNPAAPRQVLNYLRATNLEVGLLLHFGPEARVTRISNFARPSNPYNPLNP